MISMSPQAPTGWGWASLVGKGDYLNFIGIADPVGPHDPVLPGDPADPGQEKGRAYVVIAIVEVLVLSLAASGLLKVGGH